MLGGGWERPGSTSCPILVKSRSSLDAYGAGGNQEGKVFQKEQKHES